MGLPLPISTAHAACCAQGPRGRGGGPTFPPFGGGDRGAASRHPQAHAHTCCPKQRCSYTRGDDRGAVSTPLQEWGCNPPPPGKLTSWKKQSGGLSRRDRHPGKSGTPPNQQDRPGGPARTAPGQRGEGGSRPWEPMAVPGQVPGTQAGAQGWPRGPGQSSRHATSPRTPPWNREQTKLQSGPPAPRAGPGTPGRCWLTCAPSLDAHERGLRGLSVVLHRRLLSSKRPGNAHAGREKGLRPARKQRAQVY